MFEFVSLLEKTRERWIYMRRKQVEDEDGPRMCIASWRKDPGLSADRGLEQQRTLLVQDRQFFLFLRQHPETTHRATTVEDGPLFLYSPTMYNFRPPQGN